MAYRRRVGAVYLVIFKWVATHGSTVGKTGSSRHGGLKKWLDMGQIREAAMGQPWGL